MASYKMNNQVLRRGLVSGTDSVLNTEWTKWERMDSVDKHLVKIAKTENTNFFRSDEESEEGLSVVTETTVTKTTEPLPNLFSIDLGISQRDLRLLMESYAVFCLIAAVFWFVVYHFVKYIQRRKRLSIRMNGRYSPHRNISSVKMMMHNIWSSRRSRAPSAESVSWDENRPAMIASDSLETEYTVTLSRSRSYGARNTVSPRGYGGRPPLHPNTLDRSRSRSSETQYSKSKGFRPSGYVLGSSGELIDLGQNLKKKVSYRVAKDKKPHSILIPKTPGAILNRDSSNKRLIAPPKYEIVLSDTSTPTGSPRSPASPAAKLPSFRERIHSERRHIKRIDSITCKPHYTGTMLWGDEDSDSD